MQGTSRALQPPVPGYVPADPEDELSESTEHFRQMRIGLDGLDEACQRWGEPYSVLQNVEVLFEGDPGRVCPDQAVIRGIGDYKGRSYDLREMQAVPVVVFEYSSPRSGERDLGEKKQIYERLGVQEYFVFHVEKLWFLGFRHSRREFRPIQPGRNGRIRSRELGVELGVRGGFLRMFRRGKMLLAGREKDKALVEKDEALAEKDEALAEKDEALAEKDRLIEELRRKLAALEGGASGG